MTSLNGDMGTVRVLKQYEQTPEYATKWLGRWTGIGSDGGSADLANFLKECKTEGVKAHLHLFYAGDNISPAFFRGQATPDGKTLDGWWKLVKAVALEARRADAEVLVNIETEWNKGGVPSDPIPFDTAFRDAAKLIKSQAPKARIVCAPGAWGNIVDTLARFPGIRSVTDVYGTQCLYALTRHKPDVYAKGPDTLLSYLRALASIAGGKPLMVTDLAFSSYGGNFATTHPFNGGDGRAAETQQRAAFVRLGELLPEMTRLNVVALFVRSVKDVKMDPANYFGYAEQYWGVVRGDDTKKPAFGSFVSLASSSSATAAATSAPATSTPAAPATTTTTPTTTERTYSSAEYDAVSAERDREKARADSATAERDAAVKDRDAARTRVGVLEERIKRAQDALSEAGVANV